MIIEPETIDYELPFNRQNALDKTWQALAECRHPEYQNAMFFPSETDDETLESAKSVCAVCAVTEQCLQYALAAKEKLGVWGGMSEQERARVRRGRPAGITRRSVGRRPALNPDQKADLIARYAAGERAVDLADEYGIGTTTAQHIISAARKAGLDVPYQRRQAS
jgi:WhiB family transcriptional regulator, redox-sensing transcriptional regulator